MKKKILWIPALIFLLVLLITGCEGSTAAPTFTPTNLPDAPTLSPTATSISETEPSTEQGAQPEPTALPIGEIAKSSVRIDAYIEENGKMILGWNGSGTIISQDGLILTNAHVVVGGKEFIVNIISNIDQPPIPSYYAELRFIDYILDLALIQVTTDLDGNPVNPKDLSLPMLQFGKSEQITIGQEIQIFGYPGVGGETITFTKGSISGFESADLGNGMERILIKTDADIAPGNSGGSAVDEHGLLIAIPSAGMRSGEGETLGHLRPVDLVSYLLSNSCAPLVCEASVYEPNNDIPSAYGPLESGKAYSAYIHPYDFDFYLIDVQTLAPIEVNLTSIPENADYDLVLIDAELNMVGLSEGEENSERIVFSPTYKGKYYIAVGPHHGYNLHQPYTIQADFNGKSDELGNVTVQGRLVNVNSGEVIAGATIGLLVPGISGEEFMESEFDEKLIQVWSTTDEKGIFVLENVPRGEIYSGFVVVEKMVIWANDWLTVRKLDPDNIELGDIQIQTE